MLPSSPLVPTPAVSIFTVESGQELVSMVKNLHPWVSGQELVSHGSLSIPSFIYIRISSRVVCVLHFCRLELLEITLQWWNLREVAPPFVVDAFFLQGVLRNGMLKESVGHTHDVLSSLKFSLGF
ncbi:unnamed protein product [Victoria cruziana]